MGAVGARDRAPHGEYSLSWHRALDHRRSRLHHAQLQALRRAARGAAHETAAGEILRRTDQDPADPVQEAHGLAGLARLRLDRRRPPDAWPDQLREKACGNSTASTTCKSSWT